MNSELEKELKDLQIQYDKVCHERNLLIKKCNLLKKDVEEYQKFIKKGVEVHYAEFMKDYDTLLEEYEQLIRGGDK